METVNKYGITHTVIDMLGFYGGNMIMHNASTFADTPSAEKTLIFGVSDLLVRNGFISYGDKSVPFSGQLQKNTYIALVSFLLASGYDLIKSRDFSKALMKNLITNAIGLGSNQIIDMIIDPNYI